MKRRIRLKQILELLELDPELSLAEACGRLSISSATIRRAFAALEATGQVVRTWGGIQLAGTGAWRMGPPAFARRLELELEAKRAIARAAAAHLKEGDVVMIDGGTTTFQLADFIALKQIRVLTNSLVIAQAIDRLKAGRPGAEVHLAGGLLEPDSGLVVGPRAEAFLGRYRARWALLGAAGVDVTSVSNYNEAVLASEKRMIGRSDQLMILADSTKLGRQALCELCPLEEVDHLLTTESARTSRLICLIRRRGVTVTCASE